MRANRKFETGELEELIDSAYCEFDGYPLEDEEIIRAYNEYTEGYAFDLDQVQDAFVGSASGTLEEWYVEKYLPEIISEDVLQLLENSFITIDASSVDTTGLESEYYLVDGYVFRRG